MGLGWNVGVGKRKYVRLYTMVTEEYDGEDVEGFRIGKF